MKKFLKSLSAALSAVILFTVIFSVPVTAVTDAHSVDSKRLAYFRDFVLDLLGGVIDEDVPSNVIEGIKTSRENADKVLSDAGSTQEQTDSACAELEAALLAFDNNVGYYDLPPYAVAKGAYDAVASYFYTFDCDYDFIINIPLDYKYAQYVILPAYFSFENPLLLDLDIGGYNFKADALLYPSGLGCIAYNYMTGDICTLENAFENNVIPLDSFYEYYTSSKDAESLHFSMGPSQSTPEVDKSILSTAIINFHPIGGGYVTPDSYERHFAALEYATSVYDNPDATRQEVDSAIEMLSDPQNALVGAQYDTGELERYYDICEDLCTNHLDEYTYKSQDILVSVLDEFHCYVCKYKCSQSEVDEMAEKLKAALSQLEYANPKQYNVSDEDKAKAEKYAEEFLANGGIDAPFVYTGNVYDYEYNNYVVLPAYYDIVLPVLTDKRIGGFIFECYNSYGPSDLGSLAVNCETGDVLQIEDAFEQGIIDLNDFYEFYRATEASESFVFKMRLVGDCNDDGIISVSDATEIQKSIAHLSSLNNFSLKGDDPADVNHDNSVDISDATAIQKQIARLV